MTAFFSMRGCALCFRVIEGIASWVADTPGEFPQLPTTMRIRYLAYLIAGLQLFRWTAAHAETSGPEDRSGLRCISSKAFPVPEGAKVLAECDFETDGKLSQGWSQGNGAVVTAADAPQGKAYFRMKAKKNAGLRSPIITAQPGMPYFLSYWIKTAREPWTTISFTSDERERSFTTIHTPFFYSDFPLDTGSQWRQEGFYFLMPPQCKTVQFNTNPREDGGEGEFVSLDDVRLRTASEAEMAAAYDAERGHLPPYDVTPRPGDGKNLALSVAKWEGRAGIPGKPFVIWALGSSFTDRQGDGYELVQAIRRRFPKAPPIIYRKHGGPGTPWEFVDGWIKQFVAGEQPDLIFCYTSGTLEGLDAMLTEIRRRTTAEVIVPTLHFKPDSTMTPDDIENGAGVAWGKVREICAKHGVEFVENRREMAEYIAHTGLTPDDLLYDHNHQNNHGKIRIWDNVSRHLAASDQSAYTPESRERRIAVAPPVKTATEEVSLSGAWNSSDGLLKSSAAGARLKVSFTGNRIDMIGRRMPGGGSVKVLIDGVPAEQAPVFLMDYIQSKNPHNWRIPHAVDLGANPAPQTWTITMTSDVGDYRIEGSVTGADGTGNLAQPFLSHSGQIGIDPKFWRQGRVEKKGQPVEYGVAVGDAFTFDVYRSAVGELSFKADQSASFSEPLVRNLPNQKHTLELITTGNGDVEIEGLYVFEPPEK
jgi:hypothetical protein